MGEDTQNLLKLVCLPIIELSRAVGEANARADRGPLHRRGGGQRSEGVGHRFERIHGEKRLGGLLYRTELVPMLYELGILRPGDAARYPELRSFGSTMTTSPACAIPGIAASTV